MSRKFLTSLDLGKNELQNAVVQNLSGAPASPVKGQIYMNTTDNTLWWWNGASWVSAAGGGTGFPGYGPAITELTFGSSPSDGVATTTSRSDHKHGNPIHDNAAHAGITALAGGPASGDLTGTYPAPTIASGAVTSAKIADGTIVPADVNPLNVDGADSAASLRTLGLTGGKAMPGRYDLSAIANVNTTLNNISMGGNYLTGLPTTPPPQADYAASKGYVDSVAQGLDAKQSVKAATTASITLSGTKTVDGVALVAGDRVLVKNQGAAEQNGIYVVALSTWTRASDADTWNELVSAFTFVEQGTTQSGTGWVCIITTGTLDANYVGWVQFSGAGMYLAGAGLVQNGANFDVNPADASLTVTADTIAVKFAGNGSAVSAARSDHTHTASVRVISASTAAATSTVVNHAFNTRDVTVNVYRNTTPWDTVDCDVERTDVNNVTVRFNVATTAGEHRIVVTG